MKTLSILILSLSLSFTSPAQASDTFVDAQGKVLSRREAVVLLAANKQVFKLQEMTLGAKGTIHVIKKAVK